MNKLAVPLATLVAGFLTVASANPSREPKDAVANLDVAEGLEATLFASEPMILSPSAIDIDSKGRVWVCEVVNYRRHNGKRKEGDRIMVLEDTTGDGKADKSTVFYQGRDVDTALGICVLGNQVIVSVAPNIFVFTDEDGDLKADKKEVLFSKTGQPQHDHSNHSFVFGPDGKYYWNFGNTGRHVHDKDGKPVVSDEGHVVNDKGKPYRQGMVFRCNPDGSEFEVLGHNFRNNYEVAVDSFGTLWQSDNDDDGNKGTRINYVMEHGNFGYVNEKTGAGWRTKRTNMEKEIPHRHWHLNDPGVVPNLLQTGSGSPCGILVYEGSLLPKAYQNQMIHCEPGHSVVRVYPVKKNGAGYSAEMVELVKGARDNWFRPADVTTAPDGSVFVADWYDPGVGGHGMGDLQRGRIFRVAPKGHSYKPVKLDLSSAKGAVEALKNPNISIRRDAWVTLNEMGAKAEDALKALWGSDNARHRARALWLLGEIEDRGAHYVQAAITDKDPDIRITGLRLARHLKLNAVEIVAKLSDDKAPEVLRECALALRLSKDPAAVALWAKLAGKHDGKDRWYLEALGIGAEGNWDAYFGAWLKANPNGWKTSAGQDIIWRARATGALDFLVKIIKEGKLEEAAQQRFLRAFDFHDGPKKDEALLKLLQ